MTTGPKVTVWTMKPPCRVFELRPFRLTPSQSGPGCHGLRCVIDGDWRQNGYQADAICRQRCAIDGGAPFSSSSLWIPRLLPTRSRLLHTVFRLLPTRSRLLPTERNYKQLIYIGF